MDNLDVEDSSRPATVLSRASASADSETSNSDVKTTENITQRMVDDWKCDKPFDAQVQKMNKKH